MGLHVCAADYVLHEADYSTTVGDEIQEAMDRKYEELGLGEHIGTAPKDYSRNSYETYPESVAYAFTNVILPGVSVEWWKTLTSGTQIEEETIFILSNQSFRCLFTLVSLSLFFTPLTSLITLLCPSFSPLSSRHSEWRNGYGRHIHD